MNVDEMLRATVPLVGRNAQPQKSRVHFRMNPQRNITGGKDIASSAKRALERVCSGKSLDPSSCYYSPKFVDYVNDMKFLGLEGARQSVALYTTLLSDIDIVVKDQIIEGDKVTSRFVVSGSSYGRKARFNGITISRFEDGLIVEDWSITDSLGMLRQLGIWRSVLAGIKQWRTTKSALVRHFGD